MCGVLVLRQGRELRAYAGVVRRSPRRFPQRFPRGRAKAGARRTCGGPRVPPRVASQALRPSGAVHSARARCNRLAGVATAVGAFTDAQTRSEHLGRRMAGGARLGHNFSTSPAHGVGDARRFASSSVSESAARIPATLAGQRLIAVAARAVGAHLARRGLLVWSWLWDSRLLVVIVGLDLNGFDLTDIRPDPFGAETSHASSYTAWVFDCMNGAGA